jgi:hypothetical protein
MAGTSIAHVEDPVSAVFGNPATLTTYYGGTNFMFGATFYMPRVRMQHDGTAGRAVADFGGTFTNNGGATHVVGQLMQQQRILCIALMQLHKLTFTQCQL